MEVFKSPRGEQAALRAATQSNILSPEEVVRASNPLHSGNQNHSKFCQFLQTSCLFLCMPLLWLLECFLFLVGEYVCRFCNRCFQATKEQAKLCLDGRKPWLCSMRLTSVNVVVACSTWYMFSDQVRLAFVPPGADDALAVINLVVWCILMTELLFEVFIRPDGYQDLIISDKAYAPTTLRYINAFHLVVETVSLLCFIPEFYCLLTDSFSCDGRLDFSFFNAALMGVIGPEARNFFYGKAYFALIRLRVFGLVRHWKKMWINNTFINMRWKAAHGFFSGSTRKPLESNKNKQGKNKVASATLSTPEDPKKGKESVLTNASNIGTALMVTNSYRVLIILCAIVGLFPILSSFASKSMLNRISSQMVEQLQATNLRATDNRNETCRYLSKSVISWVTGLTPNEDRKLFTTDSNVYLLSLEMSPAYCEDYLLPDLVPSSNGYVLFDVCRYLWEEAHVLNNTSDVKGDDGSSRSIVDPSQVDQETQAFLNKHCMTWMRTADLTSRKAIADVTDIRTGAISVVRSTRQTQNFTLFTGTGEQTLSAEFRVVATFNETYAVESA